MYNLAAQLPYLRSSSGIVGRARHAPVWLALFWPVDFCQLPPSDLTRSLVNATVAALRAGATVSDRRYALLLIAMMAALLLFGEAARVAATWIRTAQAELIQEHIAMLIQRKSVDLDLAFYDNAEFYDRLHRARDDAKYRPIALLENLGGIVQNGITLASMMTVLISFGSWLPAALLLSSLPRRLSSCTTLWTNTPGASRTFPMNAGSCTSGG